MRSREWPFDGEILHVPDDAGLEAAMALRHVELTQQHHDLDYMICALSEQATYDELLVARLKKRKLQLKDEIARLTGLLHPTGDAAAHP
jgi:hypothetical protein